jgi:CRP-like cAMP-binding protein
VLGTGQISRKIYSLSEGDCVVIKDDVQIGHIGKSELFGEIAFILGCSSTATVQVASEEATVLAFDREALEHKLSESTELAAGFFQYLARMLRNRLVASETEAASKFGL